MNALRFQRGFDLIKWPIHAYMIYGYQYGTEKERKNEHHVQEYD